MFTVSTVIIISYRHILLESQDSKLSNHMFILIDIGVEIKELSCLKILFTNKGKMEYGIDM